jgi:hypothetical protein
MEKVNNFEELKKIKFDLILKIIKFYYLIIKTSVIE